MEGLLSKECVGKLERDGLRLMQLLRYVVETVDRESIEDWERNYKNMLSKTLNCRKEVRNLILGVTFATKTCKTSSFTMRNIFEAICL